MSSQVSSALPLGGLIQRQAARDTRPQHPPFRLQAAGPDRVGPQAV
jgi:hypothetical protein